MKIVVFALVVALVAAKAGDCTQAYCGQDVAACKEAGCGAHVQKCGNEFRKKVAQAQKENNKQGVINA